MSDEIMENQTEATDAPQQSQANEQKMYSQEDFDRHMSGLRKSLTDKFEKQFADLGDINELRALKATAEKQKQDEAIKAGQFEDLMKDLAQKKDAEITKRDNIIREYRIDAPLMNAAAKHRSVNPEQVKSLLKNQITLGEDGDVFVTDANGVVKYKDDGSKFGVDDLVETFLQANPHFKQPTPASTGSKSSVELGNNSEFSLDALDMKNPEHRKRYAKARADGMI